MRVVNDRPATIYATIRRQAEKAPDSAAITAPGGYALGYRQLLNLTEETVGFLNRTGVGRGDRVAIVLPSGPEMAIAFLSIAAGATAAPLNPNLKEAGFHTCFLHLGASALVVMKDSDSPAIDAARSLGIVIIEAAPGAGQGSGLHALHCNSCPPKEEGLARPDDVALVLHTAGTTSQPKIVPLTHANICNSAHNIQESMHLEPRDRCLNIMPLFHIHGLIGALLSSIAAGASVACAPGFIAPSFFDWMDECKPTWYTAVPTMHQAILARARTHEATIAQQRLRFIRSCSASLPPQVIAELESVFSAPVVEAYGMTEASHQMSINPLPPRARKPGSVGLAGGIEIAIMDGDGNLLAPDCRGEIVIRGASVMKGYENNPDANGKAFTHGWFRTGDQGYLDQDHYLFITGRIKEMINRGGEQICPREVDEALLDHPDVIEALSFAVPDKRLGEDVGAAVVLRKGAVVSERNLRLFVSLRLAEFKVPRVIVVLDELPKGSTGKPQRIGLAERLGVNQAGPGIARGTTGYVPPKSATERAMAKIWQEVLKVEKVSAADDFIEAGGDSILALQVLARIRQESGIDLSLIAFFENPTIAGIAAILDRNTATHGDGPTGTDDAKY